MIDALKKFWGDEGGLVTVEYALLLALIAVGAIVAWQALGYGRRYQGTFANAVAGP